MGSAGGTSISPNHLTYRWKVETKRKESIKEKGENKMRDRKIEGRDTVAIHNQTCSVI